MSIDGPASADSVSARGLTALEMGNVLLQSVQKGPQTSTSTGDQNAAGMLFSTWKIGDRAVGGITSPDIEPAIGSLSPKEQPLIGPEMSPGFS